MKWRARAPPYALLLEHVRYVRQFYPIGARQEFIRRVEESPEWFRFWLIAEFCPALVDGRIELREKDVKSYEFLCDLLLGRGAVRVRGGLFMRKAGHPHIIYGISIRGGLKKPPRGWRRIVDALMQAYPHLFHTAPAPRGRGQARPSALLSSGSSRRAPAGPSL